MKRNIFLFAFILFFIASSNGQSINYGLSIGANLTNMKGNGIKNSFNAGWFGGGFARIDLSEKWNLQPELLFNYANNKKATNFINYYNINGNAQASEQIKLSYINVPVLIGYKVSKLLTINVGPQYSFLVYDDENLVLSDKAVAVKRNDIGILAGVQVNVENVRFFANYVAGVANVNNIDDRYKWYNRQVFIGMNFNFF
ncbi:MAG: outer membrane beta-barrel protein [Ginsengibacter sp.]